MKSLKNIRGKKAQPPISTSGNSVLHRSTRLKDEYITRSDQKHKAEMTASSRLLLNALIRQHPKILAKLLSNLPKEQTDDNNNG